MGGAIKNGWPDLIRYFYYKLSVVNGTDFFIFSGETGLNKSLTTDNLFYSKKEYFYFTIIFSDFTKPSYPENILST